MAQMIVLVGGLPDEPDLNDILKQLRARAGDAVIWEWVRAGARSGFRPPNKYMRKLLTQIQQTSTQQNPGKSGISIVKLPFLNGDSANTLHKHCDPVQVPKSLCQIAEVLDWLFSDEANLIPKREWLGNRREAALAAILSKLIKNKSWNKDTQGHTWTKEEDLLGQSPVLRNDYQAIAVEANRMLSRLEGNLLAKKGGTAGTPKEWCIRQTNVSVAKKIVLEQSFAPLEGSAEFDSIRKQLAGDDERCYRIDGEIVSEQVRATCRMTH